MKVEPQTLLQSRIHNCILFHFLFLDLIFIYDLRNENFPKKKYHPSNFDHTNITHQILIMITHKIMQIYKYHTLNFNHNITHIVNSQCYKGHTQVSHFIIHINKKTYIFIVKTSIKSNSKNKHHYTQSQTRIQKCHQS